jgi:hypothetical protein
MTSPDETPYATGGFIPADPVPAFLQQGERIFTPKELAAMARITPDVPGRGAWTLKGGLLKMTPTSRSAAGFYRLAVGTETQIGSAYVRGKDTSDSARSVQLGVLAIQKLAGLAGPSLDGWYGKATDVAVRAMQDAVDVTADGIVGPATMRAALSHLVYDIAEEYAVPAPYLGGIAAHESGFDPGAVGVNGFDHGLVQINLDAHAASVSIEDALDPEYALRWAARELRATHDRWSGRTRYDLWKIAILNHNSPLNAQRLAQTGKYPTEQAASYVASVLTAW